MYLHGEDVAEGAGEDVRRNKNETDGIGGLETKRLNKGIYA